MERPPQVQPRDLEKVALIYMRQSTAEQVRDNTGSTEYQKRQAEVAQKWGWPRSRIEIIDDDLGVSGSRPGSRQGFREMLERMRRSEVGIVFVSDASRLSRNPLDAEEFLWVAMRYGVLVDVNGKLFSPGDGDLAELLNLRFQNLFAWFDHATLRRRMDEGKRMKAGLGHAVTPAPIGLVMPVRGKWGPDPNLDIRESIRRVFLLYPVLKSANKVARDLRSRGLTLPRKTRGGEIVWESASQLRIIRILRNPNYTDAYVYNRTKGASGDGSGKRQLRPRSEWQVFRNHHEGLVTWEEWEQIQAMLDGNRRVNRPPILDGAALLQGLLWCSECGRRVRVAYDRRVHGLHLPAYFCGAIRDDRLHRFHRVPAERLDHVVVTAVLAALGAPAIDDLRAVLFAWKDERESSDLARDARLKRAEADVAEAKRRYLAVDPHNDLVHAELEADFQAATRRRDEIKAEESRRCAEPPLTFGTSELDELVTLSRRVDRLWHAATTKNEDRKRLLHAVLSRVEIRKYTEEWVDLKMVWVGGLSESHRAIRSKGIDAAVAELRHAGLTDARIAKRLHAQGVVARGGGRVCRAVITKRVSRGGLQHAVTWRAGLLRIRELLEQGWSSRQILEELKTVGPRHYHNAWNLRIVQEAIRRLRVGRPLHGVPPLPSGPRPLRKTPPETIELMLRRRQEGHSWRAIANELNASGLRRAKALKFTDRGCATLACSWRARHRLLP